MCPCATLITALIVTLVPSAFGSEAPQSPSGIPDSRAHSVSAPTIQSVPAIDVPPAEPVPNGMRFSLPAAAPLLLNALPEQESVTVTPPDVPLGSCVILRPEAIVRNPLSLTTAPWPPSLYWICKIDNDEGSSDARYLVVGRSCGWVLRSEIMSSGEAVRFIESQFAQDESGSTRFFMQGLIELVKQSPESAIANFTESLRLDPKDQGAYYYRGLAYGHKSLWLWKPLPSPPTPEPSREETRALGDLGEVIRQNESHHGIEQGQYAIPAYLARAVIRRSLGLDWSEQARSDFLKAKVHRVADPTSELIADEGLKSLNSATIAGSLGAEDAAQNGEPARGSVPLPPAVPAPPGVQPSLPSPSPVAPAPHADTPHQDEGVSPPPPADPFPRPR